MNQNPTFLEFHIYNSPDAHLHNRDYLEVLKALPNSCVDLVVCDPPFGITRNDWDQPLDMAAFWPEIYRVCKRNAAIIIFSLSKFTFDLYASNPKDWRYKIIWQKIIQLAF